jgi:hypothetical protein
MREQTERVREQRERLVGHGEAGSYVTYLWRREQWLRHMAADAPVDSRSG